MGLIYSTAGWVGASAVVTHASGAATYTVPAVDVQNPLDVAADLAAWLIYGSRPWGASIDALTCAVEDDGAGRHRFVFTFEGLAPTFTSLAPDAQFAGLFGDISTTPPGPCPATCSTLPATRVWQRWDTTPGARSREGSFRAGSPRTSLRRPSCELAMDLVEAFTFGECCRLAAQPRTAYVFDEGSQVWRFCAIGTHDVGPRAGVDATGVDGTLQILGLLGGSIGEIYYSDLTEKGP